MCQRYKIDGKMEQAERKRGSDWNNSMRVAVRLFRVHVFKISLKEKKPHLRNELKKEEWDEIMEVKLNEMKDRGEWWSGLKK